LTGRAIFSSVLGLANSFRTRNLGELDSKARSRERYRRAILSGAASALARLFSVSSVLISIPITLHYLGVDRFSVWMTITSLTILLSFADFGLGNGLMNAVSRSDANADPAAVRSYISSALVVLLIIAGIAIAGALLIGPALPWSRWLAVKSGAISDAEITEAMIAFIICIAVAIPANLVQKVQLGLQMGYLASGWQLLSSVATLGALLAAVAMRLSLPWLVVAVLGTPSLVFTVSAVVFWTWQRRGYRPNLLLARRDMSLELLRSGGLFLLIQVAGSIAFGSDTIIIAHVLGAQSVAQYSVASKIIDGLGMVCALFLTPLWPAYADAHARGEKAWIVRTLFLSLGTTAVVAVAVSLVLVAVSRPLILLWVGPQIPYSLALIAVCAAWGVIKTTGSALAMFLNGVGMIGFQAVTATIFSIAVVAAKVEFARAFGIIGVPLALSIVYLATNALPQALRIPKMLRSIGT
jgi:O-antigen/teichoic acid export membrane protein